MERIKKSSVVLFCLLLAVSGYSCGKGDDDTVTEPEITPNEFARELGLPLEEGPRRIPESDFGKYTLVVDVFRRSTTLPVLGEFRDEYVDSLAPDRNRPMPERLAIAKKKFEDLAGREFAILSIKGSPYRAQIVSGGLEGYAQGAYRTTPPGAYRLTPIVYEKRIPQPDGTTKKAWIPYPWLRSRTFGNSIMFWGLWLYGGYFFHSTTHYGVLGKPASMGCIRQAYPDAMEAFELAQRYPSMIRVHPIGSRQAYDRFRAVADMNWALPRLDQNLERIRAYVRYAGTSEISLSGHGWIDPASGTPVPPAWPNCGPVDCFQIWGRARPE